MGEDVAAPGKVVSRRAFFKAAAVIGAAALVPKQIGEWVKRGDYLQSDLEPTDGMIGNVSVEGAHKLEVDENRYEVGIEKAELVRLTLQVAQIEGGTALVGKVRSWLVGHKLNLFLSPLRGMSAIMLYPDGDYSYNLETKDWVDGVMEAAQADTFTEALPDAKNGLFTGGSFWPPSSTVDGRAAVLVSSGVVEKIFFRKLARENYDFANRHKEVLGRLFRFGDDVLAHELWHFARWVSNPDREEGVMDLRDGGYAPVPPVSRDAVSEVVEVGASGIMGALVARLAKEAGLPESNLKGLLAGLLARGIIDPWREPYSRTGHPVKERDRVEEAFATDPEMEGLVWNVFKFTTA